MYTVTREPITDSDRDSLARSYKPTGETAWLPLGIAVGSLLVALSCFIYVANAASRGVGPILAVVCLVCCSAACAIALWKLFRWFAERGWRSGDRRRYDLWRETRVVEVVHFQADAAWRIPEDEFDPIDDQLGVLYRVGSDAFVIAPLNECSTAGSESRVPAEVRVRRTAAPLSAQLSGFEAAGPDTLPLQDNLQESASLEWVERLYEKYSAGGALRRHELPEKWRAMVRQTPDGKE